MAATISGIPLCGHLRGNNNHLDRARIGCQNGWYDTVTIVIYFPNSQNDLTEIAYSYDLWLKFKKSAYFQQTW